MVTVLRIFLALVFLANLGGVTNLAISLDAVTLAYPKLNDGLVALLFLCGLASLAAVALLWRWRRAGIHLITAAFAVMFVVNLYYEARWLTRCWVRRVSLSSLRFSGP